MANPKNNIYPVNFDSELCLNKYDVDVTQYSGFNKKNSPIFGGTLSPFWKKEETETDTDIVIDNNGNKWSLENGNLYKTDLSGNKVLKHTVNDYKFVKTDLFDNTLNVLACLSEDTYVFYKNQTLYAHYNNTTITVAEDLSDEPVCCLYILGDNLYGMYDTTAFKITSDGTLTTKADVCDNIGDITNCIFILKDISNDGISYNKYLCFGSCYGNFWSVSDIQSSTDIDLDNLTKLTEYTFKIYLSLNISTGNFKAATFTDVAINNLVICNGEAICIDPQFSTDESTPVVMLSSSMICYNTGYISENTFTSITLDTVYQSKAFATQNVAGSLALLGNSSYKTSTLTTAGKSDLLVAFEKDSDGNIDFNQGMKATVGYFSFLINNKELSGISYKGILLTEWNTVSNKKIIVDDDSVIYCDNSNTWHKITIQNMASIQLLNNRYIVINTTSQANLYDIETERAYYLYSDYNGWGHFGYDGIIKQSKYETQQNWSYSALLCVPNSNTTVETIFNSLTSYYFASGYNCNFETSQNPALSLQLNPSIVYSLVDMSHMYKYDSICSSEVRPSDEVKYLTYLSLNPYYNYPIDFFYGDPESYAYYQLSCRYVTCESVLGKNLPVSFSAYKNSELTDLTYPVQSDSNIIYSVSLFSEFIESFINNTMVLINKIGYPLIYYNNKMLFAYYFLNGLENVTDLFVIQGMNYAVCDDKIFSVSYSSGSISGTNCIVSVENMQFCGATATEAYLWADTNKTLYVFKGDNSLTSAFTADSIGEVLFSSFNPTTNSIYIATDIGVYVIGSNGTYRITDTVVDKIYRWLHGLVLVTGRIIDYYSFVKLDGFEVKPIEIETKYYGLGNNAVSVNDCVFLRFFDPDMKSGTITISSKTLNNETFTSESKTINVKSTDWDKESNTLYVRYQPKYQRCTGFSVKIESPFAIGSMAVSSSPDTILVSKTNS